MFWVDCINGEDKWGLEDNVYTVCDSEVVSPACNHAALVRRNQLLLEHKRFEAIELQKFRKTATRRCRNCLTPYRDQNPGSSRFMCSYCGHISKRPVLDLPVHPGMSISNSGIIKELIGKGGKILNGKGWTENVWMSGEDWFENGNLVAESVSGKHSSLLSLMGHT